MISLRGIFLLGLILVLCAASANALVIISSTYGETTNPVYSLKSTSYSFTPSTVYPGDKVILALNLENRSASNVLRDANISLDLPNGFTPLKTNELIEGSITPSVTKTVVFEFNVNKNTYPGTYVVSVKLDYAYGNQKISDVETINLVVETKKKLDIRELKVENLFPHQNEPINISAKIKNLASIEARGVQIELVPITAADFAGFVLFSDTVVQLDSIKPNDYEEVEFLIQATEDATPKAYAFKLEVSSTDFDEVEPEIISFELKGKPDVIISGIDLSIENRPKDKKLLQGDSFSLSIQLDNIGTDGAKSVKIELDSDEAFTGIKESYVGGIDEDDSSAAIFDLSIPFTAKTGDHELKATISFLDEFGEEVSMNKTIDLYISQRPPESPIGILVLLIIVLVLLYFIIRMLLRYFSMRKVKGLTK
ncbi:MAG: CARDB domain-containing protein [archaeon]